MSSTVNTNPADAPPPETDSTNPDGYEPIAKELKLPEGFTFESAAPRPLEGMLSYEGACVRALQLIGGMNTDPVTPDLLLIRLTAFLQNTDTQVRQLHTALEEQNGVLVALAQLSGLQEGHLYTEMIDIFKAWKPADEQAT